MKKIAIINGPNLNLLGRRETEIYGDLSFEEFFKELAEVYSADAQLSYFQSNEEGELINKLHEVGFDCDGIVLNPGGYGHTSVALRDAISAIRTPVVEVHISNIFSREPFRHQSLISGVCRGVICGFGLEGYVLAIDSFLSE
ncbi:MAG: type II 3-dehydroquinate dehydratase [Chitinophagales bacterium]|nr:type II 3-dehydroquinate dehydratase [Chitinophagales bacterium]